ncbi:hypothetical protein EBQ93_00495 [bacterium]|nr:hypothetical protein [bacterium]
MYGYHKLFVETSMLLRAIVAQARTWGVAVGTQLNNCSDVVITNLTACGNNSDKDSAFGLIFANNCTDCKVYGGQFNNNEAWAASDLGHTFANTIDIRAMNQFWAALDVDMLDFNSTGYVASSDAHYGKLNFLTDANATTGRLAVRLTDDTISELCTPCGPMAAGIVIGDTTARVDIADVTCAGNKGNAGQAYGLMHDVSVGASVQNSRFFQNMSNTCGIAFGLADFTPQSLSVHLGNTAFGNQYHVFMDSNYIVPFHPGAPYNLEFPVKVGYNGNITELANASPYDNIEIRFIYNAPTDPTNLPDGVFADWEDLNFVSSGDGHLNFEYNSPNLTFATQAFADSTTDFTDFALTMGTSANPTTTTDVYTGYTVGTGTKVYIGGTMKYFGADGEKVTVYVGGLGSYTYITRTPSQGSTSNGFLHVYSDAAKTNELFVIPLNASTFTSDIVP